MIDYFGMVKEFHEKYRHDVSDKLCVPPEKTVELRYRLIEEEMQETLGALRDILNTTRKEASHTEDLINLADGLADSIVVLMGTALSFGIPIDRVFAEVHRSNMTKSTAMNEYGKTIKGDKYEPPQIKDVLFGVKHE